MRQGLQKKLNTNCLGSCLEIFFQKKNHEKLHENLQCSYKLIMEIRQKLSEENLDSFDCFNKENKASLICFFHSYS